MKATYKGAKYTIEQLDDCEKNLWYVTECDVSGVVGVCAETEEDCIDNVRAGIVEMRKLNKEQDQ